VKIINIQEAKTHLSRLVEEALAGEELVIAKAGKPLVKLVPFQAEKPRVLGALRGQLFVEEPGCLGSRPRTREALLPERSASGRPSAQGGGRRAVKLLVDSNALLWTLFTPERLSRKAQNALLDANNQLFMSVASRWELEIKRCKGRIQLVETWASGVSSLGMAELPIRAEEAAASTRLPWHHSDLFDRVLVAQALTHGMTLVTRDTLLAAYGVHVLQA
jgi:prevent-host-death family protein